VAILASGELLVVGLVFAGDESSGNLKSRALGQTNITGKSADFTSDFLHALFALHNCGVDFVNTFNNIGLEVEGLEVSSCGGCCSGRNAK